MCGIIAALCNNPELCSSILFSGLKYMQNRGYDSAGICSISNESGSYTTTTTKFASTQESTALQLIEPHLSQHSSSFVGFGHTRWATHGAKTDTNSHPHTSTNGYFTIVHNGILENYRDLKSSLIKKGMIFQSETDTEVIANLLENVYLDGYSKDVAGVEECIQHVQERMSGSWGLVIFCKDTPNNLYCVRHGSPLLVGKTDNEIIVVSEQAGFGNRVNSYFILNTRDICTLSISEDKSDINMSTGTTYTMKKANQQLIRDNPSPYPHWTIREIHEQPECVKNAISMGGRVLSNSTVQLGGLQDYIDTIKKTDNLILLGCGTSYHSGMIAMNHFKTICDLNCVLLFDGAEFTSRDIPRNGNTTAIFISQSGETKDLHRCISIAKEHNVFTVGVINVVDSLIAREVNCGVYLNAGTEVAVASTKAFTSQTLVLTMIAVWIAQQKGIYSVKREEYIRDIRNLSHDIESALTVGNKYINDDVVEMFHNKHSCFLLGKGTGEGTSREGALKIKEIAYIHTEGYSSSALKHGPFALLENEFPVIIFVPSDEHFSKNYNALQEVASRGANILCIHNSMDTLDDGFTKEDSSSLFDNVKHSVCVPFNKTFQSLINIVPIQMLAYKLSISKGINPDRPKNLAKVVTVE
jgi:glutamine---fructose-6-phosphate transaminase (isomerizing)